MDIFKMFFGNIFERKGAEYRRNLEAGIRRNTIGRVQSKATDAMSQADRKVFAAQNKAINGAFRNGKSDDKASPAASSSQQQAPANKSAPQSGAGQSVAPQGGAAQANAPKVNSKWLTQPPSAGGGGGGGGGQWSAQAPAAAQAPTGGGMQAAGGMANYGSAGGGQERTQAIDIRALEQETRRSVVGWIVAQNGNHQGMDFRLFEGKNVIGTAANCDIVVTDSYLSARHCTIRYDNGNFVIIDLDSRNGTYVNQKRISKEDLIDNDTVRLGKADFKFKSLF